MAANFDFSASASSATSPPQQQQQHAMAEPSVSSPHHPSNVTIYQTTGPDAHYGPVMAPGDAGTPLLNPRSCVTCRRRKVRCDKQMPCSNCRRALIPCVFPAPGRAPRQHRAKDPNAAPKATSQREVELVKRLKKLEGIVEELSGQIEIETGGRVSSTGASPSIEGSPSAQRPKSASLSAITSGLADHGDGHGAGDGGESPRMRESRKQLGRLVLNDSKGTSRYVSSGFWSRLNDELDAIREETQKLTDEDADDSEFEESPPIDSPFTGTSSVYDHHGFILGYRSIDVNLQKCHPLPSHGTFLWSVYLENVDPLLKILHVPTMEAILRDARRNPEKLAPGNEPLVFAVYFAAVVTLEEADVQTNFSTSKEEVLAQFRFAVEQSLAKANFLNTSDFTVVQALALFLLVVRRHDESRFAWSLTALVIRIAQGLGIHRDGSHFGLSPYETEQRRRLWWSILTLDFRSSEEMGTDLVVAEGDFDTQLPTSINDADITPTGTQYPVAREGKSDTTISLVRFEVCAMSRRLHEAANGKNSSAKGEDDGIAEKERLLVEFYKRIEDKFLQHLDEDIDPLYWVAAMISRIIMAKMCLILYQPMLFPGAASELTAEIRERIYIASIEIVEYNHKLNLDPRGKQYRWLFRTYTNWHAIAYILVETCRRPWSALVQRGWEAVVGYDKDLAENIKRTDHASVFLPLRKLFTRAKRYQELEVARLRANPEEAKRLDLAERIKASQARFDPIPGAEARMQQVRDRWRAMVNLAEAIPAPLMQQAPMTPLVSEDGHPPSQQAATGAGQHYQQSQLQPQVSGENQIPMDLSNVTMEYMDAFMAQSNVPMAELWSVGLGNGPALGMDGRQQGQGSVLGQQQMMLPNQPQQPKNEHHVPPYLWPESFASPNQKFDLEDADMLGADFNWQDWAQSVRGLGMDGAPPKPGW
ncbi:fungal-specific transcription factor domain-containing protein [Trichoderma novae-zelandiae]